MTIVYRQPAVTTLALAVSMALGLTATTTTQAYESPLHVFTTNDIQGGFDGSTFGGLGGSVADPSIICTSCPPEQDKQGVDLFPIDSEFGFYIVDFLGAAQKYRDDDYLEGFAGNFSDATGIGLKVSNQATETYKVKPPFGTWCRGLGGNSVKCETEHYTVMEHVLSCHEVIPYLYADQVLGTQEVQSFDDVIPPDYPNEPPYELPAESSFDCALAGLDDAQYVVSGGVVTDTLLTSNQSVANGGQMDSNDLTTVLDNYSVSNDYTITLKDDGKPDYHWGALIKRPNDIRMYARFDVPAEWTAPDAPIAGYTVTKALLYVDHWVTNNPNDQLRPEDIENEAATGRKPSYRIEAANPASPDPDATVWKSTIPCYEGDADTIDTEDGALDPTFIGIGTYLKNTPFAYTDLQPADPCDDFTGDNCEKPQPLSSDLTNGFTNAFYTTINRDPFEWSYLAKDRAPNEFKFIGCAGPVEDPTFAGTCEDDQDNPYLDVDNLELVSGPRWRLKANKFGQDLPGLEIPVEECSPPPFEKDNIKYNVGERTTTVINLLDWDTATKGPSPLSNSVGWVDTTVVPSEDGLECTLQDNPFIKIINADLGSNCALDGPVPITSNGMPITDGFDLAVYVKGDRKSTALYNARLVIEYEGETPPDPDVVDMRLASLVVPERIGRNPDQRTKDLTVTACNDSLDNEASGIITLEGVSLTPGVDPASFGQSFVGLAPSTPVVPSCVDATFTWTAPTVGTSITWTAEVAVSASLVDPDLSNNTATGTTLVYPLR